MIWATVSSRFCLCWPYRASPFLAAKNINNLISVLTIWWCPCVQSSLLLADQRAMTSAFSWQSCQPLPCFVLYWEAKLSCYSRYLFFFFLFKIIFYSSIVNSQCFRYTADWFSYNTYIHTHIYVCVYCCYVVIQSCPALCDPVDWSPPGSSFHGISQARIWDWVATPSPIQIYLLTSYFCIPIPCDEKDFFFWC